MLCHVCESELKTRFAEVKDSQTGAAFSILACDDCGLRQTSPMPADLNLYYENYHGGRHGATADFCANRRVRWLEESYQKAAGPRKILDIGCGEGTFLLAAQKRGWQIVGVELNSAKPGDSTIEIHETLQAVEEKYGDESFAAITLWHVLEHLKNPRESLQTAHRLLAPNGKLLIAVPDARSIQAEIFGKDWLHLDVPRHLYHFSFKSIETILEQCDFQIENSHHQEFEYDLLGWSQSALNKIFVVPNVFFQILTGRNKIDRFKIAVNFALGAALTIAAMPLVPLGNLLKRGGTIIVEASKTNEPRNSAKQHEK